MSKPAAGNPQPSRLRNRRLSAPPVAANDDFLEPTLRLAPSADPGADEAADSLLMALYAHIRALEAGRD
jgi:hypothetical protein